MKLKGTRILVDTCVWVDNYCTGRPCGETAKRFLAEAYGQGALLLYAVHTAKDVLFVLESEFKRAARQNAGTLSERMAQAAHEAALGCMFNMCGLATAAGADGSDVWLAEKYLRIHRDFEDNLVLAACKRAKADFLVTNDRALIEHADLVAKTPGQMLELMHL